MSNDGSITGWFTAGVATVVASLSSVVAFLFKLRENENTKRITELKDEVQTISVKADKCEEERGELRTECVALRGKIDVLEVKLSRIDINGTKFSHQKMGDA